MNHVPTVGSVAALGLFLLAYVRRNEHLKHVGLEVLFVIALVTLPVYVSGIAAQFELRNRPDISVDAETYEVKADGQLLVCEPASVLPMAQRYFLF